MGLRGFGRSCEDDALHGHSASTEQCSARVAATGAAEEEPVPEVEVVIFQTGRVGCAAVWDYRLNDKMFLNSVSEAQVSQIARSYACAPLALFLLDTVFSAGIHPPGFKRRPRADHS